MHGLNGRRLFVRGSGYVHFRGGRLRGLHRNRGRFDQPLLNRSHIIGRGRIVRRHKKSAATNGWQSQSERQQQKAGQGATSLHDRSRVIPTEQDGGLGDSPVVRILQ